jgi:polyisoprenoid-binding protein YceI
MTPRSDRSVRLPTALPLLAMVAAATVAAEPRTFVLDPEKSRVHVHVGKSGLFKFAGHEHDVEAPMATGEVVADPADLTRSSVSLEFETARLRVTGRGEPPEDVPKVQEAMRGERVLDAARFPTVRFRSERVQGRGTGPGVYELTVTGHLQVRDRSVTVTFPVSVDTRNERLLVTGRGRIKQSDFGITPVSVAGVVKVRDELELEFHFEGTPRSEPPAAFSDTFRSLSGRVRRNHKNSR